MGSWEAGEFGGGGLRLPSRVGLRLFALRAVGDGWNNCGGGGSGLGGSGGGLTLDEDAAPGGGVGEPRVAPRDDAREERPDSVVQREPTFTREVQGA